MGIGNLHQVLDDYDGGRPVPYAQLYFDSAPDHHAAAYRLLAGLRRRLLAVLLARAGRGRRSCACTAPTARALARLAALQSADDAGAAVLHPPDRTPTSPIPRALAAAYQDRTLVPLPANAARTGPGGRARRWAPAPRRSARRASLYRGLRPVALRLLIEMAARVRALSGRRRAAAGPQHRRPTRSYQQPGRRLGSPAAPTGWSFSDRPALRRAARRREAFQAMLDRLQSLNLIAWARETGGDRRDRGLRRGAGVRCSARRDARSR